MAKLTQTHGFIILLIALGTILLLAYLFRKCPNCQSQNCNCPPTTCPPPTVCPPQQPPEVFWYQGTSPLDPTNDMAAQCAVVGAVPATLAQLTAAWNVGASWCSAGVLNDNNQGPPVNIYYPTDEVVSQMTGCGGGPGAPARIVSSPFATWTYGLGYVCFGVKPPQGALPDSAIRAFNTQGKWSMWDQ